MKMSEAVFDVLPKRIAKKAARVLPNLPLWSICWCAALITANRSCGSTKANNGVLNFASQHNDALGSVWGHA